MTFLRELLPIIIAGLTTGSNEQREHAAYAIGDLMERTDENAIKPFVVPFTGPLIRVTTQATTYPPGVKIAIPSALTSMLECIPLFVKPFFSQLQRTFVKSISDPSSSAVRSKAAEALGVLMTNQPRVDPLIIELVVGVKSNDDSIATWPWQMSCEMLHKALEIRQGKPALILYLKFLEMITMVCTFISISYTACSYRT